MIQTIIGVNAIQCKERKIMEAKPGLTTLVKKKAKSPPQRMEDGQAWRVLNNH